jgi:DNA-binding MarR family transcriptional regulator
MAQLEPPWDLGRHTKCVTGPRDRPSGRVATELRGRYSGTMSQSPKQHPAGATQAALEWHETVPDERIAHLVRDARRGLSRVLQMRLNEHGIASGHWTFLRILWRRDGLTQRELSDLAGVMEPTTFSALQAMERLGYVSRQRRPENRKNIYVFLTESGRALESKLVPMAEEINGMALQGVAPEDAAAARRALMTMIRNVAKYELAISDERRRVPSTRQLSRLISRAAGREPGERDE